MNLGETDEAAQIRLRVWDFASHGGRRFTREALVGIDAELRKGPFRQIEWTLMDAQRDYESPSIAKLLEEVPISRITKFSVDAWGEEALTSTVRVDSQSSHLSADAEHPAVEASRLALQRVRELIKALPKTGRRSKFGPQPPSVTSRLRAPDGLKEWAAVAGSLAALGGLVLKLAGVL